MVALCMQCGAPLTPTDLGYDRCLNCHWQEVFEQAASGPHSGELRLVLHRSPAPAAAARDRGKRPWAPATGDGQIWCTLCGQTLAQGWVQGQAGGLQTYVCAEHVDWE